MLYCMITYHITSELKAEGGVFTRHICSPHCHFHVRTKSTNHCHTWKVINSNIITIIVSLKTYCLKLLGIQWQEMGFGKPWCTYYEQEKGLPLYKTSWLICSQLNHRLHPTIENILFTLKCYTRYITLFCYLYLYLYSI